MIKMKMMKKIYLSAILFAFAGVLSAQNNTEADVEEEIELPDVTTVISGGAFTAGKDSVPDYRKILPETDSPSVIMPEMGRPKTDSAVVEERSRGGAKEKDIYAEGELGGGYPFYFTGDFSVYRASGNSPFSIEFAHESAEGFAGKKAAEGYFERNTRVGGKKSWIGNRSSVNFRGEYKTSDDGLQFESDVFTDMVKHTISGSFDSSWNFDNGLFLGLGAEGKWFNRYGQLLKDDAFISAGYISKSAALYLEPFFNFGWRHNGLELKFKTVYDGQFNLKDSDNLEKADGSSSSEASNRFQFSLGAFWKQSQKFELFADGSLAAGSATGSKELIPFFVTGINFGTSLDEEGINSLFIKVSGGIDSYQSKLCELENTYKYAVAPAFATETTDFFGKLDVDADLFQRLKLNVGAEFRKTAFKNGLWQADYSEVMSYTNDSDETTIYGVYKITAEERTDFNTHLGGTFDRNNFKFGGLWTAYWKDVPVLKEKQNLLASVSYQSADTKWNAGTSIAFAAGKNADKCPDISGWAGVKLAPALTVAFRLNDSVKLFARESRKYAHSDFIQKSGSAVLLVKFQF